MNTVNEFHIEYIKSISECTVENYLKSIFFFFNFLMHDFFYLIEENTMVTI